MKYWHLLNRYMKNDFVYLQHMLDSASRAISYIQGKNRYDLDRNPMLLSAVVRELEIIGEAANRVSLGFRETHCDIPWFDMINMRHRLIHEYFRVDVDIVWKTIQEDIPPLEKQIKKLLEKAE